MAPAIFVRDLVRRYGAVAGVSAISFAVARGEIFGLLGPNGAGKTTILESILGLREVAGGEIRICGLDGRRQSRAVRAKIGAVLQATGLQDKITPKEALEIFSCLHGASSRTTALLERFGLRQKQDAAYETLSGGQKQRLAMALAFVGNPQVLILDEPSAGLDPVMRREVQNDIRAMKQEGCAVLLATHDMQEAEALCDRIAVIAKGRIVALDTPKALIANSRALTLEEVIVKWTGQA